MIDEKSMTVKAPECIRTLRLKVKAESYPWLNAAAAEVNQVWNWCNETSYKAARPFAGPGRWLTGFDLDKLAAGASECFEHIGSDTIQRVNAEFALRRRQAEKVKRRWRVGRGARRALGWIPFKAVQLKRKGKSLRFAGKAIRVFERELLDGGRWKSGCFAQDAVGDWWLCLPVERQTEPSPAINDEVGLDLGLKDTVATSDGEKLEAGRFYRDIERKIARAQRRGHKRQARYQSIIIGDVSSTKLVKTRMAKSVLDAGWGCSRRYCSTRASRPAEAFESSTSETRRALAAAVGPSRDPRVWTCVL
jgi:hypothetical protein